MKLLVLDRHPNLAGSLGSIQSVAKDLGYHLLDDLSELPDIVLVIDWDESFSATISRAMRLGIQRVLVMHEPTVVIPKYHRADFRSLFTKILEVGRPSSNTVLHWPQNWNTDFFDNDERLERMVAISSNKYSFVPGELYSLRAKAYSEIDALDLFGRGWDRAPGAVAAKLVKELLIASRDCNRSSWHCVRSSFLHPQNYIGHSPNKLATLSNYRYTLAIENSLEFMSEKLVDGILAGSMPIYVGPPAESFGIPESLVFQAAPTLESIKLAHKRAAESDKDLWKRAAKSWIEDPSTRDKWEAKNCNARILESLNCQP